MHLTFDRKNKIKYAYIKFNFGLNSFNIHFVIVIDFKLVFL